jgi:hypothetical protein
VAYLAALSNHLDALRHRLGWSAPRSIDSQTDVEILRHYKDHFPETAKAFRKFLRQCDFAGVKAGAGQDVAVVVLPWVSTPVPWFSVALGIALARRGANVAFIWDDSVFPVPSEALDRQNEWIDRILSDLRPCFRVVRLSTAQRQPAQAGDETVLERLVSLNLVWALRGGTPTKADLTAAQEVRGRLREALSRIRRLLADGAFRYVVVPGGVHGTSGLYLHAGQQAGTRVATFDSGFGWTVACPDGVVAHQVDVPRAFSALYREDSAELAEVVEEARAEYGRRTQGGDRMKYQTAVLKPVEGLPDNPILIPLSVEWDSSALGRHHIFQDSADWLVTTVGHLLEHTDAPVIVRQHPSERREFERSRFRVGSLLGERFGKHPRYHFISAEEDVNTYGLLDSARLVLPYISTIGIEAAAIGKTVIPAGQPYYSALGFTWNASSQAEYLDLIGRGAAGTLPALPDQVRKAWLCFYINAVRYRVFTDFSPQPPDFSRWCRWKPETLFATPEVEDLLTAIDENRPVPLVRHARAQSI